MPANTIIQTGTDFRLYSEAVTPHATLPAGVYKIQYSPLGGYWLSTKSQSDLFDALPEKLYGNHGAKVDKILRRYTSHNTSLGVMFSGDKGMGKSLAMTTLAHTALTTLDLPVVIASEAHPNIAEFIDQLGECMVIFDEFEKVFEQEDSDLVNQQTQFLNLLDGMSSTKRLYVFTVNDVTSVSDYMLNRPGRIHYHIRFTYPTADDVRAYLHDNTEHVDEAEIKKVVIFAATTKVNYDHLRAIASELNAGETFAEAIEDLNIKTFDKTHYVVTLTLQDGSTQTRHLHDEVNLYANEDQSFPVWESINGELQRLEITFNRNSGTFTEDGFTTTEFTFKYPHADENSSEYIAKTPVKLHIAVAPQADYNYALAL